MYTMVLMMAVTSGGDVSGFGHRSGCNSAPASCHGTVVATGCTGTVPASCHGAVVSGSCHGHKSGIFGMRDKMKGLFSKSSCHGSSSCHGTAVVAEPCCPVVPTGCIGGVITMPPAPKDMPKPMDKPKVEDKPKSEDKPKTESN